MYPLQTQLREILKGQVCLVGLGNVQRGDDGLGVRLAEECAAASPDPAGLSIVLAGTQPECHLGHVPADADTVVFLDAVELGASPGAVAVLDSAAMRARYPQVSTHRLSLGLLAQLLETGRHTRAWLLAVQPESLRERATLSATVRGTVDLLREMILECIRFAQTQNQIA